MNLTCRSVAAGLAVVLCAITALSAQRAGGQGANAKGAAADGRPNRITGRITGTTGLPERSVIVSLLEKETTRFGTRVGLVNAQLRVVPNERGEYSIDAAPGSYYVVAIPVHEPVQPDGRTPTTGYAVTYYPDVTEVTVAKEVTVTMSKPVVANIALRPTKLFSVAGTARWSDGLPAASGGVGISSDSHLFGLDGRRVALGRDGTFRIPAVGPGRYCLQHAEQAGGRDQRRLVSAARVTVVDRDLSAVRVVPVVPVSVKGRVILDPADRPRQRWLEISVGTSPAAGGCYFGTNRSGIMQPNGAVEFFVEPIDGYIRVSVNRQDTRPVAVRHAGAEVPHGRFTFARTTPLTGVEIELAKLPPAIGR